MNFQKNKDNIKEDSPKHYTTQKIYECVHQIINKHLKPCKIFTIFFSKAIIFIQKIVMNGYY